MSEPRLKAPGPFASRLPVRRNEARSTPCSHRLRAILALWTVLFLAPSLPAQAGEFVMGLDLDQSGSENCTATLGDADGSQEFTGLDRWVEVVVDPTPPAQITSLTVLACIGNAFTHTPYSHSGGWPVAVGAGIDGTDGVEWEVPSTVLDGAQSIRLVVGSRLDGGEADAILSAEPIVITAPSSVPLLSWVGSLILALALVTMALLALKRFPRSSVVWLLVGFLAMADHRAGAMIGLIIDGALSDWAGIPTTASDPAGDSADSHGRGDIRALTAALDSGALFVRVDAGGIEDAPCQTPPSIEDSSDLSTCAGTPSGDTCSLACQPGWQASQAEIACQYGTWEAGATCSPIELAISEDTTLADDLAVARLEVASGATLTLDDGVALSVGELSLDSGSVLGAASANVSISVADSATLSGDARIVAQQLTLSGGDWSFADAASIEANLEADVAALDLCAHCSIIASNRGHPATTGSGAGPSGGAYRSGSGAGHGAGGGVGFNSMGAGGNEYGDGFAPEELGSGGGYGCGGSGAGGAGGGFVRIHTSGALALTGSILADGANGSTCMSHSYYGGGGGSGGSIWIEAGLLHAPAGNRLVARGGAGGGSHASYRGGGGAGGRILVTSHALVAPADTALWSVEGGTGRSAGSRGSLWFHENNDWTAHATQSLDGATEWDSLTLAPDAELSVEPGSSLTLTSFLMEANSTLLPAESTSLSTDTLVMSAGTLVEGDSSLDLSVMGTATLSGDAAIQADELTLSGGTWSLEDAASLEANLMANVAELSVCTNCTISASALGHTAATGPGAAASVAGLRSASGAGHGGAGSTGFASSSGGGTPYGDGFAPDTAGSGGGNGCSGAGDGGAGGGVLRIQVSGTLNLAGSLLANGAHGANCMNDSRYGGGGGSGGSIWVSAATLQASPGNRITAYGGTGGGSYMIYRGGGGGGGRVLIEADAVAFVPDPANWSVSGGSGRSGTLADTGTLWLNQGNDWTVRGANTLDTAATWNTLTLPADSEFTLEAGASLAVTELTLESGARILPEDNTSVSTTTLTVNAGASIEAGIFALSVSNQATLSGDAQITADQLTLTGGDWSLEGAAVIAANLDADVKDLAVCANCSLTASGLGYPAASGPGETASASLHGSASGAGHGGTGGIGFNTPSPGGDLYGNAFAPDTPGSGGGNGCTGAGAGGAGGGTLRIQTSGTLSLAGSLLADGANGLNCSTHGYYGGGGGAGGSIWLSVATLEATAGNRIQAQGGQAGGSHGTYRGGGGGGGRIMITATAIGSEADSTLWSTAGGVGRNTGEAGSLWFQQNDDWVAYGAQVLDSAIHWNSLTLASGSHITLETGMSLTLSDLVMESGTQILAANSAPVVTDTLVMQTGSLLEGDPLDLTVGSTANLVGDAQIVGSEIEMSGGNWLLQDTASITGNLDATLTNLTLCVSCSITASGRGHAATEGPGSAASQGSYRSGSGAGHGGTGGTGYNSSVGGGSPYGDALAPETWGSGGANGCSGSGSGGAGGGSLRLQISESLVLKGSLLSNGSNGAPCADSRYGGGGGAGGSIWITTGVLDASAAGNRIEARGGQAGGSHTLLRGGGGGGGRVQIQTSSTPSGADTSLWSVSGGTGHAAGDAGSARLEADGVTTILSP